MTNKALNKLTNQKLKQQNAELRSNLHKEKKKVKALKLVIEVTDNAHRELLDHEMFLKVDKFCENHQKTKTITELLAGFTQDDWEAE